MDDLTKIIITGIIAAVIAICFNTYLESQHTKAAMSQGLVQCPDARSKGGVLWQHSCN